jgi:hypothetical protein
VLIVVVVRVGCAHRPCVSCPPSTSVVPAVRPSCPARRPSCPPSTPVTPVVHLCVARRPSRGLGDDEIDAGALPVPRANGAFRVRERARKYQFVVAVGAHKRHGGSLTRDPVDRGPVRLRVGVQVGVCWQDWRAFTPSGEWAVLHTAGVRTRESGDGGGRMGDAAGDAASRVGVQQVVVVASDVSVVSVVSSII